MLQTVLLMLPVCLVPPFWAQQPRPRAPAPGSHNASALASAAALLYDIGDDAAGDSPDSSATTAASAASAHPHPGSQPASKAPPPAAPPAAAPPGGTPLQQAAAAPVGAVRVLPPPPGLQVPQYTLRELPPPLPSPQAGSPTPHAGSCSQQDKQQQLEVVVMLPGVGGPGEVDVWLAPEGPGLGPAGGGGGGGSLLRVTVAGRYHLEVRRSKGGAGTGKGEFCDQTRVRVFFSVQGLGRPYSC